MAPGFVNQWRAGQGLVRVDPRQCWPGEFETEMLHHPSCPALFNFQLFLSPDGGYHFFRHGWGFSGFGHFPNQCPPPYTFPAPEPPRYTPPKIKEPTKEPPNPSPKVKEPPQSSFKVKEPPRSQPEVPPKSKVPGQTSIHVIHEPNHQSRCDIPASQQFVQFIDGRNQLPHRHPTSRHTVKTSASLNFLVELIGQDFEHDDALEKYAVTRYHEDGDGYFSPMGTYSKSEHGEKSLRKMGLYGSTETEPVWLIVHLPT